jgi:hypothetical protein
MPRPDVGIGFIWPAATGRDTLRKVVTAGPVIRRDDVVIQRFKSGAGPEDEIIFEADTWCMKTSVRRRFGDPDEGRTGLLRLARKKMQMGRLVPSTAIITIQPEESGGAWLWSIMPWFQTLQQDMELAVAERDEAKLSQALVSYAEGIAEALIVAARQRLMLEIHPDNFARCQNEIYFLDDNIGVGSRIPRLGRAILQRCVDFAAFPSAINDYINMLATYVGRSLNAKLVDEIGLLEALSEEAAQTPETHAAYEKLARQIGRQR